MTMARHLKRVSLALLAVAASAPMPNAFATGTVSGTPINNTASVNYTVGGVTQTAVNSNTASFVVDNRIDLTVTETSNNATVVAPGQTNVVAAFTVRNTGNTAQGFILTAQNNSAAPAYGGGTDNSDVNNVRVFVDANGNGAYDPATDTALNIATLAPDTQVSVIIVADVPLTATNGQYANVRLIARAATNNTTTPAVATTGADTAGVDIVFGDGATDGTAANDATAQDEDQYAVQSAVLSVVKSSAVISDPVNLTVNPKAIPLATVEYTIVVTNGSTTSGADSVVLADVIPTNTTYVAGSLRLGAATLSDTNDADAGRYEATPTPRVVVNAGTVAASGGTSTVRFRVTIN
jgi:uncharacterized repeat protein (TIGR01451 family)